MPLTLVTGPPNSAKARVVLDGYRAALHREPLLVVPTFGDVEHYRRELAASDTVFGARVMRFSWLVQEIARRTGTRARPLGRIAQERVAAVAVERTKLARLAASAATPGFIPAFVALVRELEEARIEPPRLIRAVREREDGPWAHGEEVAALYRTYRRVLDESGRTDETLAARAAIDALRADPQRWRGTPVFLYGFDDLSPLQYDAVDTLANRVGADVVVSLTFEPGRAGLAARAGAHQELLALGAREQRCPAADDHYAPAARPVLHHLERSLGEEQAASVDGTGVVTLIEGGGERAEAEALAAHVAALIREHGYAPGDIAVVHRGIERAAPLFDAVLREYGVAFALDRTVPAGHTALGRATVALLRAALPALAGSADDLLAYLRAPGLLEVPALADSLEAEARRDGVLTAAAARALWERDRWPLDVLDRVAAAQQRGVAALCDRIAAEIATLSAAPWRPRGGPGERPVGLAPVLWGPDTSDLRAAAAMSTALAQIVALPAALHPDPATLTTLLAAVPVRVGEPPGVGRVTVADPLALRARRVRALICAGCVEGVFPAAGRSEPFFSDAERRALNAAAGLRLRLHEDRGAAERFLFHVTLSRPTDLLTLSWPAADDDGRANVRSPFVDDVLDVVRTPAPARRPLGAAGFEAHAPTVREAQRAAAAAGESVRERRLGALTDATVLAALRERVSWSASALELWSACPVRWFVERHLDLAVLDPDPEAMIRGALAHKVLQEALSDLVEGGGALTPARLPHARALVRATLDRRAEDFRVSVNPERLRAALRRLEVDLVRYVEHAAHCGSAFVPTDFELSFGGANDTLPAVELGGGELRLHGRIDRLDRSPDGTQVTVYDYKGASAAPWREWRAGGKIQVALYARAVQRLLGLDVVAGLYQPLSGDDPRPRGIVRDDADPGLVTVRGKNGDRQPAAQVEATLAHCEEVALAALHELRAGALEPRPQHCAWRGGCAHPTICRCVT